MSDRPSTVWTIILVASITLIVVLPCCAINNLGGGTARFTVKQKWIDNSGDSSTYLVSSTDDEIYEVDNSFLNGQSSIDKEWNKLDAGVTVDVEYRGMDIHILGGIVDEYPKIYSVTVVT